MEHVKVDGETEAVVMADFIIYFVSSWGFPRDSVAFISQQSNHNIPDETFL